MTRHVLAFAAAAFIGLSGVAVAPVAASVSGADRIEVGLAPVEKLNMKGHVTYDPSTGAYQVEELEGDRKTHDGRAVEGLLGDHLHRQRQAHPSPTVGQGRGHQRLTHDDRRRAIQRARGEVDRAAVRGCARIPQVDDAAVFVERRGGQSIDGLHRERDRGRGAVANEVRGAENHFVFPVGQRQRGRDGPLSRPARFVPVYDR